MTRDEARVSVPVVGIYTESESATGSETALYTDLTTAQQLAGKERLSEATYFTTMRAQVPALIEKVQQRVAIARALAAKCPIILADEPTGNLDGDTAADMIALLQRLAHEKNKCVIVVTHSRDLARSADVVYRLKGRSLVKHAGN